MSRRKSHGLEDCDYSQPGGCFVTICTRNKSLYFNSARLRTIAEKYWAKIPEHFPAVNLDEWVLMPNHLHGIVVINES